MKKIHEKTMRFVTALTDVYREEERRELCAFDAMELNEDITEDLTSMLIALSVIFERLTESDFDLLEFTHVLNKLAVQYILDGERKTDDQRTDSTDPA